MPPTLQSPRHRVLVDALIELRERAGLTQQELADRLGRYQSVVAAIESGQRRVDLVELLDILEALDADILPVVESLKAAPRR